MKNYHLSCLAFFIFCLFNSQAKPITINNNTSYKASIRIEIYSKSICKGDFMITSVTIMPNTSVTYYKYENSNLGVPPIAQYLLNGPNPIYYNDPLLAFNGLISSNTDWEQAYISTMNTNNETIDHFKVGVFRPSCGRKPLSTHYGTHSTAAWITHPTYHEVNIY